MASLAADSGKAESAAEGAARHKPMVDSPARKDKGSE
jgi:hypothetical protein